MRKDLVSGAFALLLGWLPAQDVASAVATAEALVGQAKTAERAAAAALVVEALDVLERAWPPDKEAPTTIVVLPEYVARHWWDRVLYNQTAKRLKGSLVGREHTVIADVPYRRSGASESDETEEEGVRPGGGHGPGPRPLHDE